MTKSLLLINMAAVVALLSTGCTTGDESNEYDDFDLDEDGVSYRMSFNRMSFNALKAGALGQLGFDLVSQAFGQNNTSATMANTVDGVDLLRYAARCAFEAGTNYDIKDLSGITHPIKVNPGVGLLSDWATRALTTVESRWLVSCLLAHVNAYGDQVPLSLRGHHSALATDPAEEIDYPYFEGAFYGELSHTGEEKLYACYGADLLAACSGDAIATVSAMWGRVCTQGGCANFEVVGQCSDYDGSEVYACAKDSNGIVSNCFSEASTSKNKWPSTAEIYKTPVVNTYLKSIDCTD